MVLSQRRVENVIVFVAVIGIILIIAWGITGERYFAVAGLFLGISLIILARIHWGIIRRKPL